MRKIELLAPAKDLQTGREAILHGADAVYIGAPRFGARAAAGNTVDDIWQLVEFAHSFGVRIYVTLNTILYDEELQEARRLVQELQEARVDALIVQDVSLLESSTLETHIPLHASTQMDNRTADKVRWLWEQGFSQAVLARELSLEEIAGIHREVPQMPLEVFVHGATCVSYNGQCYASQYCFERSANRGECAQFCRMPFDLLDEQGSVLEHQRHFLSLHDMRRSEDLEALLDAGVTSLKIEGRLKDTSYVKNVTAYYRQKLDEIMRCRPKDYGRSSWGHSSIRFTPNLSRSFNRGFSDYFLHGRTAGMVQLATPKSMGERVGQVKEVRRNCFTVSGLSSFHNGDGLCFLDDMGRLQGFRVNRVEGNCLYPKEMLRGLRPRMPLYRNYDQEFEQLLTKPTAVRKLGTQWTLTLKGEGVEVLVCCENGVKVSHTFPCERQLARTPQQEAVKRQIERLGDTIYELDVLTLNLTTPEGECFIPASILADWRRQMVSLLDEKMSAAHPQERRRERTKMGTSLLKAYDDKMQEGRLSYLANVANREAKAFYLRQGAKEVEAAMECKMPDRPVLMTARYCVRYEMGLCPKHHGVKAMQLNLRASDGRVFPLEFDCRNCQMKVLPSHDE